jgi:EmrB/QacA subfamily drug resistance transporter
MSTTITTPHSTGRALLVTLCVANFMATLDVFVVNVALSDIGTDLGSGALANLSWVLNAYAIVFGALLIPAGRIADRYGRRRVFLTGLLVFTLASAGCALCPDVWSLVALRCVQAAGAAILVPSSLGLVLANSPAEHTSRDVRLWAITAAVAAATGPVVGGLLTQLDWRWIFLINVPIGLTTLLAGRRVIPPAQHRNIGRVPDPIESLLIIIAIGALSTGLVKGPDWGWDTPRAAAAWLIAAVAGLAFLAVNRRAAAPVVDLTLFRDRGFTTANVGIALAGAAMATELLGLSLFFQQSWHWSAIATGTALAPAAVTTFTMSHLGPRLLPRLRPTQLTALGCTIAAVGQALMVLDIHLAHRHSYAVAILPAWLIIGIGGGLAIPTIIASGTAGLPAHASASGGAVVQMSRQIGSVIGTAALVAILGNTTGTTHPFLIAWTAATAIWLVAAAATVAAGHGRPTSERRHPQACGEPAFVR